MHRRSFLLGVGALLTAPYVAKVQTVLAQNTVPMPLITEAEADRTLIASRMHRGFELYFDTTHDPEPDYTYREMLWEFWGEDFPQGSPISEEDKGRLAHEYDLDVQDLDATAPFALYEDQWREDNDPGHEALSFLENLDLGPTDEEGEDLFGALDFIEGEHPGSSYYAVEARDELTLHLLQARLLDLGEKIYIRIEKEGCCTS
jgi:hypothetical protein